jgi:hypothetical protein
MVTGARRKPDTGSGVGNPAAGGGEAASAGVGRAAGNAATIGGT